MRLAPNRALKYKCLHSDRKFLTRCFLATTTDRMASLRLSLALTLAFIGLAGCTGVPNRGDIIRVDGGAGALEAKQLTQKGIRHVQNGDLELAKSTFQKAIRADETYGPAHNNLGRVYFEDGDLRRSAEAFAWAMEFMPGRPEPVNNLGMAYEKGGKTDKAIDLFETAHANEPSNPEYLANLVRARLRRGDRGADLHRQLRELKFVEDRPEWVSWVDRHLATSTGDESSGTR